jgi:hypothetical protein
MASLSLGQLAVAPPLWLCTREAVPGNPQAGGSVLHRIRGAQQLDCFGVFWNINPAPPPGIGEIVTAAGSFFDRDLLTFTQVHSDSTGGITFSSALKTNQAQGYFMFSEWPLYGLALACYPGVTVDLFWLVVFT